MDAITARARALASEIKDGAVYREYIEAKAAVDSNPGYQDMLREYIAMRADTAESGDDSLERRKQEAGAYFALEANDDMNRFLAAWRSITGQICDVIDVFASICPEDLPGGIFS
jgi:cell fate (sporulation/competence/biofilm development) regulator YlbF (YheA/YmcA/DUF963 family)